MKRVALVSSGFLRNYHKFLESEFYGRMLDNFECDVYISTWHEDGYGSNATADYSSNVISEDEIRNRFGDKLKFLRRESFAERRSDFVYSPVRSLLREEPHVLEKYRSKFYSLARVEVPNDYDVYFHLRFDMVVHEEMSNNIISRLASFDSSGAMMYASEDIFGRDGCMGDIFHISDYSALALMQGFYEKLFESKYLELDIPAVPERILWHYFSESFSMSRVSCLPGQIILDRSGPV